MIEEKSILSGGWAGWSMSVWQAVRMGVWLGCSDGE